MLTRLEYRIIRFFRIQLRAILLLLQDAHNTFLAIIGHPSDPAHVDPNFQRFSEDKKGGLW